MKKSAGKNKQLQRKAERLWKEVIALRDGRVCMVQLKFPHITISHTQTYQADHCFTRANKLLFLDPANGTMVCSACNCAKNWKNKSVDMAIDDIVRSREGEEKFNEMRRINETKSANLNWGKIWWLEEQIEFLEGEKSKYA